MIEIHNNIFATVPVVEATGAITIVEDTISLPIPSADSVAIATLIGSACKLGQDVYGVIDNVSNSRVDIRVDKEVYDIPTEAELRGMSIRIFNNLYETVANAMTIKSEVKSSKYGSLQRLSMQKREFYGTFTSNKTYFSTNVIDIFEDEDRVLLDTCGYAYGFSAKEIGYSIVFGKHKPYMEVTLHSNRRTPSVTLL